MDILKVCRPVSYDQICEPNIKIYQLRLTHDISIDNFEFISDDDCFEFEKDFNIDHDNSNSEDVACNECDKNKVTHGDVRNIRATANREELLSSCNSCNILNTQNNEYEKTPRREMSPSRLSDVEDSVFIDREGETTPTNEQNTGKQWSSPDHRQGNNRSRNPSGGPSPPRAASPMSICSEKSLADEIFEAETFAALEKSQSAHTLNGSTSEQVTPTLPYARQLSESLHLDFNEPVPPSAFLSSTNPLLLDNSSPDDERLRSRLPSKSHYNYSNTDARFSRSSTSSTLSNGLDDLEATHRGIHRFIPRHSDEVAIEIGDMLHVIEESDDLWCLAVNLRTGKKGIYPTVYAQDMDFLEDSDDDGKPDKYTLKFLGSVEVSYHKGNDVLCQAISKVQGQRRNNPAKAQLCTLEINEFGIRMVDKIKGRQSSGSSPMQYNHFFNLKNVSFCGYHPRNDKFFGFITKHPREMRFAAHIFESEHSTKRVGESIGKAFRRFYQEYMATAHPTEDIWIE
ncbi:JNK-interacting protein 1-like isoform X2 [Lineus longissimus]|uniref:JNK-interacting protein 1-like isoform X2 n=1 Tax=Lineus longissimus TaxID=88925 RepID=UPI002B4F789D